MKRFIIPMLIVFFFGCAKDDPTSTAEVGEKLFTEIPTEKSGLQFNNEVVEDGNVNYFMYTYLYNGGGVGIADINNDDLPDVYFTSTQGRDKLFLNKGNMEFEDISVSSGINKYPGYKTGVNFIDINNDGWMDIYVCRSGWYDAPADRMNLLFINQKNNKFVESAGKYGLADGSRSIQSIFFDYDKDGDLDMYLSNHPRVFRQGVEQVIEKMNNPSYENSDKFYVNNNGKYKEMGREVGIFNHGWGLGIAAGDLNNDGWTDIYVSNDFQAHDYYYLNNGDGTFTESLKEYFPHCSYFAMGNDLVDINNDTHLDLFVGEMLSEDNVRQKTNMASMNIPLFRKLVDSGAHYQYMRNSFHLNNGNGHFSDIADYAGIAKTDWSWSCLFGDYDHDGDNDLLVVNGWLKDTQDKDFASRANALAARNNNKLSYEQTAQFLKSTPLTNYAFEYEGGLKFKNSSEEWGFDLTGHSNGMAYGDLDNDGDLDVVINNMNGNASLYRNNSEGNYLKLRLNGPEQNLAGLNTKIKLTTSEGVQYKEFHTTRGFQSSCEPMVHFGLKPNTTIESLRVEWVDGKVQTLTGLAAGQTHVIDYGNAVAAPAENPASAAQFTDVTAEGMIDFIHEEIFYDDYEVEVLLPHQLSQLGPALAVADVDGNGLEDVYIGGAHQQASALFMQVSPHKFAKRSNATWSADAKYEDIDAQFFDADGDDDMDLYVVSGSNEFLRNPELLEDRLYLNNGSGNFNKSDLIPIMRTSGGHVSAGDFDADGDQDLFVGGRVVPGKYPNPAQSFLLENDGGKFIDVTKDFAPELENAGMVESSVWTDFNKDGNLDLIVVGEWTDVMFFMNRSADLKLIESPLPKKMVGWWNAIEVVDLDQDGDEDFVLGNLGNNYKYKADDDTPFEVYAGDFDNSGQQDIVLGYYSNEELVPVRGLQCSSEQIPEIKKKFTTYESFGNANVFEVYGDALNGALHYQANCFSSVIIRNNGDGTFEIEDLPPMAQLAPIQDFVIRDFDNDNDPDILLAGNWYVSEVETPRADAGTGLLLENENGKFTALPVAESGFFAGKDVRALEYVNCGDAAPLIITANNDDRVEVFKGK